MTHKGTPRKCDGFALVPANTTRDGCCATITVSYHKSGFVDIITLRHFPKTVVLKEYEHKQ